MVARVDDIPPGERLIVEVAGRSVGVFNVDGRFYAFLNRCPHRGAELCKGAVLGLVSSRRPGDWTLDERRKFLVCPWHGWEFELETGQSWFDPARMRARAFGIGVEHGDVVAEELASGKAGRPASELSRFVDPATHRIRGPYQADKVPVTVESDYVVLSMRPPAIRSRSSDAVSRRAGDGERGRRGTGAAT